jgi:hypothetical protein
MSEATFPLLEPQPPTASHGVRRSSEGRAASARLHWVSEYFPRGPERIKIKAANRKAIRKQRRILMVHLYNVIIIIY